MSTDGANRQQAGVLLGAARRDKGVDLGALAAQLKVPLARLEALESGRWQDLPDGPYARGLATAVCRALGIDPATVLATMPSTHAAGLDRVAAGINQPFHDTVRRFPAGVALVSICVVLALTAAIWLWPDKGFRVAALMGSVVPRSTDGVLGEAPNASGSVVESVAPSPDAVVQTPGMASPQLPPSTATATPAGVPPTAASPAPAKPMITEAAAATLRLTAAEASWITVVDGQGRSLASRLLSPGEELALEPQAPVRVVLGNAPGVNLLWRGQTQDLSAFERQRVAKLELQ